MEAGALNYSKSLTSQAGRIRRGTMLMRDDVEPSFDKLKIFAVVYWENNVHLLISTIDG